MQYCAANWKMCQPNSNMNFNIFFKYVIEAHCCPDLCQCDGGEDYLELVTRLVGIWMCLYHTENERRASCKLYHYRFVQHYWWRSSQRRTITFETVVKLEASSCWLKIVGCYIPCSINLYGCIGYVHCRNNFSVTFVLVWVGNRNIAIFMKFSFQNDGGVTLGAVTF